MKYNEIISLNGTMTLAIDCRTDRIYRSAIFFITQWQFRSIWSGEFGVINGLDCLTGSYTTFSDYPFAKTPADLGSIVMNSSISVWSLSFMKKE